MAFVAAVVQLAQKEGLLHFLVVLVVARVELDVGHLLRLGRRRDAGVTARIGRGGSGLPLLLLRTAALQLGEGDALAFDLLLGEGAEAPVLCPIRLLRLDGVEVGFLCLLLTGPLLLLLRLLLDLLLWLDEPLEEGGGCDTARRDACMRRAPPLSLRGTGHPELRRGGVLEEEGAYLDGVPEKEEFPDEVVAVDIRRGVQRDARGDISSRGLFPPSIWARTCSRRRPSPPHRCLRPL